MRANTIGADASTLHAMGLLALTYVRTSELIAAPWEEFNPDEPLWTIPAERMKGCSGDPARMGFHGRIKETEELLAGSSRDVVTVTPTTADQPAPTGRHLFDKLLKLQSAILSSQGLRQEQIDTLLEIERTSWR
jgi:integrase